MKFVWFLIVAALCVGFLAFTQVDLERDASAMASPVPTTTPPVPTTPAVESTRTLPAGYAMALRARTGLNGIPNLPWEVVKVINVAGDVVMAESLGGSKVNFLQSEVTRSEAIALRAAAGSNEYYQEAIQREFDRFDTTSQAYLTAQAAQRAQQAAVAMAANDEAARRATEANRTARNYQWRPPGTALDQRPQQSTGQQSTGQWVGVSLGELRATRNNLWEQQQSLTPSSPAWKANAARQNNLLNMELERLETNNSR